MWSTSKGEGRDIVFVHGWTIDHRDEMRTYEPIFAARPASRPSWRRHYLDLPGMGRSPAEEGIVDMDGMLAALIRFIADRFGNRPFTLAGTSAGGYLARGLLAKIPGSIDGILLRAPLGVPQDDLRDIDPVAPLIVDAAAVDAVSADDGIAPGDVLIQTPAYVQALREKMHDTVLPAQAAADHRFLEPIRQDAARYTLSFDVDDMTQPFDGPSLVVTGRHDSSVGFRDAWRLAARFTRSTHVVLDRAEHGLPIDQQPLFAALVNDWLDRLDEASAAPKQT